MKVTAALLRRQARLMARTTRIVAGDPSLARDLPRLIRSGGRSTVRLRMPWLPYKLIDELEEHVSEGSRVFEYGGGGSTLWFLDRGAEVTTVEHHPDWVNRLAAISRSERWTLLERSEARNYADYVNAIAEFPENHFDLVVIDGRERVRCAQAALSHVRPGGWLVVDDVDRDRYRTGLGQIPWPRREICGFAPAKPSLGFSAIFRRPTED